MCQLSYIVPVYNVKPEFLSACLDSILVCGAKEIEVILVDSNSTDNTKVIMETFKKNNQNDFYGVQVLSNPKKTQPCGWNVVLKNYNGDAVVRIDAHASIPSDFIEKNIKTLLSGENICGGFRPNIIDERTA